MYVNIYIIYMHIYVIYMYLFFPYSTNTKPWTEPLDGWELEGFYLSFLPKAVGNKFSS